MKIRFEKETFRFFYKQFSLFPIRILDDVPGSDLNYDLVLTYGYIDHEKGFCFEVLALCKSERNRSDDLSDEMSIVIPAEKVKDEEAEIVNDDELLKERYKDRIRILEENFEDKRLTEIRELPSLDDLRDEIYIDDVEVYLHKKEMDLEICHVRLESHEDGRFTGILLDEPDQDLGCHKGDTISFILQKISDGTWMALADMNN